MAKALSVVGLILSLIGVVVLFRYGMPFRIPAPGGDYIITEQADPAGLSLDAWYAKLGYLGLFMIVVGTALQVAGVIFTKG